MTLSDSILATLTYSDYFGFPLTFSEIMTRLIQCSVSQPSLARQLRHMLAHHLIEQTGDYYHLPGRSRLATRRLTRAGLSTPLITRAYALTLRLAHLPGVLAIYLTGSLALGNGDDTSDIDLMIITHNGRLWTTRLLLTLLTQLLGLRRTPKSEHNFGKLCLNLYLTPASYLLPPTRRTLYTAYELIQAIPLYDPLNTRSDLLFANSWIQSYLPNFPLPQIIPSTIHHSPFTINFFEKLAYRLQLFYMHGKITREYVTPNSAFFHPLNPGKSVLRRLSLKS